MSIYGERLDEAIQYLEEDAEDRSLVRATVSSTVLVELACLRAVAEAAKTVYHEYHDGEGLRPEDPEWTELGAALKALNEGDRG